MFGKRAGIYICSHGAFHSSFNSFTLLQVYMSNLWVTNYPSGHQALIQMIEPYNIKKIVVQTLNKRYISCDKYNIVMP